MKRFVVALFCLVLPMASSASAHASTFNFSFNGPIFSGSGMFTATEQSPGTFLVNDASGSVDTGASLPVGISGILPPGSFEFNDNVLFYPGLGSGDQFFGPTGVSFSLDDGGAVNLFSTSGAILQDGGDPIPENATIMVSPGSATVTPEPETLTLLGTGLVGMAATLRRRLAR